MAFCKYSSSLINSETISLDAKFLNDYLAIAPDECLKVYLFGLLKCQNSAGRDNSIDNFVNVLNLSKEDVINCFLYWQDQNVVQVLENNGEYEIRYLPVKDNIRSLKKVESKKYASFIQEIQDIIKGRQINPNEFYKYIDFIETNDIKPCDFNMIAKFCVEKKGDNINANYILTVAKTWVEEGIRTAEKIEQKIEDLTLVTSDVNVVAKALKFRGNLSIEHQQLYEKWTKSYGFNLNNITLVAKKVSSKTKNYSFETLDKYLTKYYELKLFSFGEIENYEANKSSLIELAKEINKRLGIFYESVDNEIDTYILPWESRGFDDKTLKSVAQYCFSCGIRSLNGMNEVVQKFYKLGLTSINSINEYVGEVLEIDNRIKELLELLQLDRKVNTYDRSFYRTWTYTYKFSDEIINYAIELSKNKVNSMQYANAILTNWHDKKLTTLEEVKKDSTGVVVNSSPQVNTKSFRQREFTDEELNALFDNLDEIDL